MAGKYIPMPTSNNKNAIKEITVSTGDASGLKQQYSGSKAKWCKGYLREQVAHAPFCLEPTVCFNYYANCKVEEKIDHRNSRLMIFLLKIQILNINITFSEHFLNDGAFFQGQKLKKV